MLLIKVLAIQGADKLTPLHVMVANHHMVITYKGIGAWPDAATVAKYLHGLHRWSAGNVATIQQALATYGYTIPQTGKMDPETLRVISAFQMHFRPNNITGVADMETEAIALALVEKYCSPT